MCKTEMIKPLHQCGSFICLQHTRSTPPMITIRVAGMVKQIHPELSHYAYVMIGEMFGPMNRVPLNRSHQFVMRILIQSLARRLTPSKNIRLHHTRSKMCLNELCVLERISCVISYSIFSGVWSKAAAPIIPLSCFHEKSCSHGAKFSPPAYSNITASGCTNQRRLLIP